MLHRAGSASLAASASGAQLSTQRYLPYGGTRDGVMPTDRQFTGQRHETTLGFYDYNARQYDPVLGRFLQADTIVPAPGNPQSLNRYAYTLNNPLRYTDPSGHAYCPAEANGRCIDDLPAPQPRHAGPPILTAPLLPKPTLSGVQQNESAWLAQVLQNLSAAGANGQHAFQYITTHSVKIGFRNQLFDTGAMWWLDGNIYLDPSTYSENTPPDDPFMLAILAHEAKHLEQGPLVAFSIYGELEAWQLHHAVYKELAGHSYGVEWDRLSALSLDLSRETLANAQKLMPRASPGYPSSFLPLYPVHLEFGYWHWYATTHGVYLPTGAGW